MCLLSKSIRRSSLLTTARRKRSTQTFCLDQFSHLSARDMSPAMTEKQSVELARANAELECVNEHESIPCTHQGPPCPTAHLPIANLVTNGQAGVRGNTTIFL